MEIRFHNPYRHALLGLLAEIFIFMGFLVVMVGVALLFAAVA